MQKHEVSIARHAEPLASARRAVELRGDLERASAGAKIFMKPNIVFWSRAVSFPKWGVIATSRAVEDLVAPLKERGAKDIAIGEGTALDRPDDKETVAHAFETLGHSRLKARHGVKAVDIFRPPSRPWTWAMAWRPTSTPTSRAATAWWACRR